MSPPTPRTRGGRRSRSSVQDGTQGANERSARISARSASPTQHAGPTRVPRVQRIAQGACPADRHDARRQPALGARTDARRGSARTREPDAARRTNMRPMSMAGSTKHTSYELAAGTQGAHLENRREARAVAAGAGVRRSSREPAQGRASRVVHHPRAERKSTSRRGGIPARRQGASARDEGPRSRQREDPAPRGGRRADEEGESRRTVVRPVGSPARPVWRAQAPRGTQAHPGRG